VPTAVSDDEMVESAALRVKVVPVAGAFSLTVGASTTRSGAGGVPTATATPLEQLFVVSDSPVTESTQAP
jgi:hypothetical protein